VRPPAKPGSALQCKRRRIRGACCRPRKGSSREGARLLGQRCLAHKEHVVEGALASLEEDAHALGLYACTQEAHNVHVAQLGQQLHLTEEVDAVSLVTAERATRGSCTEEAGRMREWVREQPADNTWFELCRGAQVAVE
jgi:hypothetical protein